MGLSYGLLLGFCLLAPGVGLYAALFGIGGGGAFRVAPPAQGSITTLIVLTGGALGVHMVWAGLCFAATVWTSLGLPHTPAPSTTLYDVILGLAKSKPRPPSAYEVFVVLGSCAGLGLIAYFATPRVCALPAFRAGYLAFAYGWLAPFVDADDGEAIIFADVLTSLQKDGIVLGYEGSIRELSVDADKQVTGVVLEGANHFHLTTTAAGTFYKTIDGPTIPSVHIPGREIQNVAFEIFAPGAPAVAAAA